MKYNLISNPIVNYKASKNLDLKVMTYFLSLMPSDLSGYNVCPMANRVLKKENNQNKSDCSKVCVAHNGNGNYSNVKKARIRKTKLFFENKDLFMEQLVFDIFKAINESKNKGFKPTFRLNAYSDIKWEKIKINSFGNATIFELFPNITFYDYTKNLNRLVPSNYELTYSHWGNWEHTKSQIKNGLNVAMVFDKRHELPAKYQGIKVIDGDKTDLRTTENDGKNVIVGLKAKMSFKNIDNELKKDKSFIVS
jgi:hypothetical protein|tara:strand:+ start:1140 stop:1892 length:753 start_codon:yes stop_codon:yes gene_type:complete